MNQPKNFAVPFAATHTARQHENQTTSYYQISGVADTNTADHKEDGDMNLLDYGSSINIDRRETSPSSFSQISTNSKGTYNQFNLVTPAQLYRQASSTIQSQSSGDQASTQTQFSMSLGDLLGIFSQEAPMMQSDGENNKMAENADLNRPEESHTDEDDQDGQVS